MHLSKHKQALIALILANIIWGAAAPIFKWSLENIHPFTLAFLRFSLAAFILLPFAYRNLKVRREHWWNVILLSLLGITFNISFFFWGLERAPAINAPIIATAGPIFLLIGCFFILKERPKRKVIAGTGLGFLGVLLIILQPLLNGFTDGAVLGNILFLMAAMGAMGQIILLKKISPFYDPVPITFWSFVIGAFSFLPFFAYEIGRYGFLPNLEFPGIAGIVYGVIFTSAIAYVSYHWAIKYLLAQEVGVFAYMDPIIALVVAAPLLGEHPTPAYLAGAVLVFAGIFIAEGRIPYHPLHKWKENHNPTQAMSADRQAC